MCVYVCAQICVKQLCLFALCAFISELFAFCPCVLQRERPFVSEDVSVHSPAAISSSVHVLVCVCMFAAAVCVKL